MNFRIGVGYDIHALGKGRPLIIGGVQIPYELGLVGHSDADVLLHSITDAILGAAALGDIGQHFPDTDKAYKGADSLALLSKIQELIKNEGYSIGNLDATIIAEAPKMLTFIDEMRENISQTLKCDFSQVSVKATTNEKLGSLGQNQGIAAHSVALLFRD
ncbi:2-C-methyl-D-erythritol 2,4-cyclodiphosphate synthase [Rhodohalobacter sp. 8-1]|uniref:2-C-methyl-D-erythritol 2,4-cyclodiphosphate synthase n=1 Tax=Rhodohalobacter sp. 8-1 TaxID=3131972 RepID=UPI0030ECF96D